MRLHRRFGAGNFRIRRFGAPYPFKDPPIYVRSTTLKQRLRRWRQALTLRPHQTGERMTERTGQSSRRHNAPTRAPRTRRGVNRRAVRRPSEAIEGPKRGEIESANGPESWPQRVKREPLNPQ